MPFRVEGSGYGRPEWRSRQVESGLEQVDDGAQVAEGAEAAGAGDGSLDVGIDRLGGGVGGGGVGEHVADAIKMGLKGLAQAFEGGQPATPRPEFSLALHPEKTKLIEFGRHAAARRKQRGDKKPETFTFLGFTLICGRSRKGGFLIHRKTRADRMRVTLARVKAELRKRMHQSIPEQGHWLQQVVRGYFAYHAVPTNTWAIGAFRNHVIAAWKRSLSRRSQKGRVVWARMKQLAVDWIPKAVILHPWPNQRFDVKHPRWEPSA